MSDPDTRSEGTCIFVLHLSSRVLSRMTKGLETASRAGSLERAGRATHLYTRFTKARVAELEFSLAFSRVAVQGRRLQCWLERLGLGTT